MVGELRGELVEVRDEKLSLVRWGIGLSGRASFGVEYKVCTGLFSVCTGHFSVCSGLWWAVWQNLALGRQPSDLRCSELGLL